MLSDLIRQKRKEATDRAHGGQIMSGDDMLTFAAHLAEWERQAMALERQVGNQHFDARFAAIVAARPARLGRRGIAR